MLLHVVDTVAEDPVQDYLLVRNYLQAQCHASAASCLTSVDTDFWIILFFEPTRPLY
jgi:hypothetical protein